MTEANGFGTDTVETVVEPAVSGAGRAAGDTNPAVEPDTIKLTHEAWDGLSGLI
jgi:hypothetical protein